MSKAPDINDMLHEHGADHVRAHFDNNGRPFKTNGNGHNSLFDPPIESVKKGHRAKGRAPERDWHDALITAAALQKREFAPVSWIVPALIPEGLGLLAGKPKIGKSWLALDLCLGVASKAHVMGGIRPEHGDVLYCALEDNPRRLQKRIDKLTSPFSSTWPDRLSLATVWRRLDEGGVEDIASWCDSVSAPKLVVLDTLAGVRPVRTSNGYAEDYEALTNLHRLANDRGIGVLVLHHTRKMDAEDPIDMISGTLGLSGCADTVMVLNRVSHGTTLYGRGRDIEEFERAVEFSKEACRWRLLGDADEVRRSDTRKAIITALTGVESMMPKEIAAACGMEPNNIHQALYRMVRDNEVAKEGHGKYRLPTAEPQCKSS